MNRLSDNERVCLSRYFPTASISDWQNWKWQLKNRLRTAEDYQRWFGEKAQDLPDFAQTSQRLKASLTPYYAATILSSGAFSALYKTIAPSAGELSGTMHEVADPLEEQSHQAAPNLIHKYPHRALLLLNSVCPVYCRYCTRARLTGLDEQPSDTERSLKPALDYIEKTKAIQEVILSGGEPLLMPNEALSSILKRLSGIKHIELIRINTKAPLVLPQRIDPDLLGIFEKTEPLYIHLHVNHGAELTSRAIQAIKSLDLTGAVLGSQSVLLKGVNDDVDLLVGLMRKLLQLKVRPYALYHCDYVSGASSFRTRIDEGLQLYEAMQKRLGGLGLPRFVIDPPGGKANLEPKNILAKTKQGFLIKNWEGKEVEVPN